MYLLGLEIVTFEAYNKWNIQRVCLGGFSNAEVRCRDSLTTSMIWACRVLCRPRKDPILQVCHVRDVDMTTLLGMSCDLLINIYLTYFYTSLAFAT